MMAEPVARSGTSPVRWHVERRIAPELVLLRDGAGERRWGILASSVSPRRWSRVEGAAPIDDIVPGEDRTMVVVEAFEVGRLHEFLLARGALRQAELATILVPLLRGAADAPPPPPGRTWIAAESMGIRSTGEPVLLPGATGPARGGAAQECARLMYRMLLGHEWDDSPVPLPEAAPELDTRVIELVLELFADDGGMTPEQIAMRLELLPEPEPLTLVAADPGADPSEALTSQLEPGSVLSELRRQLASKTETATENSLQVSSRASGRRKRSGSGARRPSASRWRAPLAGFAALVCAAGGIAALQRPAGCPGPDSAECALEELTGIRQTMLLDGRSDLLQAIAVPGSPAHRQEARLLEEFTSIEPLEDLGLGVKDVVDVGGEDGARRVLCAISFSAAYRYRDASGSEHTAQATEQELTFRLVHDAQNGWRVERIDHGCPHADRPE